MDVVFRISKWIFLLLLVLFIGKFISTPPNPLLAAKAEAEQEIKKVMRDPSSAQFGEIIIRGTLTDNNWVACGTVNGRNGFGGMTGQQPVVYLSMRQIVLINDPVAIKTYC